KAALSSAVAGLCSTLRLAATCLYRAKAKRKRPCRIGCRVRKEEFPQRPATASRLERTEHCCTPLDGYGCQCPHSRGNAQTTDRTLRTGKAAFERVAAASRRHRSHPDCTDQQPLPCGVGYQ